MILQHLIAEFEQEVNSTRKLLQAVPEKDLSYKPASISWTMGELAQHIATIYYWYVGTFTKDVYDLAADRLDRGEMIVYLRATGNKVPGLYGPTYEESQASQN